MNGDAGFLRNIIDEPNEDGPRLIYADWLHERGDPRSEFIRLQCALARLPLDATEREALARREQALAKAHGAEWTKPLHGRVSRCSFRRGFVEAVTLTAPAFVEHAASLFDLIPLRRVRLTQFVASADAVANCAQLARVHELDLTANDLDDATLVRFVRSPHLAQLKSLGLSANGLTDRAAPTLALLHSLERLDLAHNHLRLPGVLARMPNLVQLDLSHNEVTAAGLPDLLRAPKLQQLELAGNPVGDSGAELVFAVPRLAAHGTINLAGCGLGLAAIQSLARAPIRRQLHSLLLDDNHLDDAAIRALVQMTNLDRLRHLRLSNNSITDRGALALLDSELFGRLVRLDLQANQLSAAGIDVLWTSDRRNSKLRMNLADNAAPPDRIDLHGDRPIPVAETDD